MTLNSIKIVALALLLLGCTSSEKMPSKLRVGQFLFSDTPVQVTIKKQGQESFSREMDYTNLSEYINLEPGTYTVQVNLEDNILLQKKIGFGKDGIYTLILYGIPRDNQETNAQTTNAKLQEIVEGEEAIPVNAYLPQLKVLNDQFECGQQEAKIRWVHLAAGVEGISASAKGNDNTSLSSLNYPETSKNFTISSGKKKVHWKLKDSDLQVCEAQLTFEPQKLYTFFILGEKNKYINRLKLVSGETPKTQF